MTIRTWLRRFFGPTDKLTTEELGGKHDVDHLPRDVRACTSECREGHVTPGCPVHDPVKR